MQRAKTEPAIPRVCLSVDPGLLRPAFRVPNLVPPGEPSL
jgi:hypothetical protein